MLLWKTLGNVGINGGEIVPFCIWRRCDRCGQVGARGPGGKMLLDYLQGRELL